MAIALATVPNLAQAKKQVVCPGFGGSVADLDRFYLNRAAKVIKAALGNDRVALATFVAPGFNYGLWYGDAGVGGRQLGVSAAIEMVERLSPRAFIGESAFTGPTRVTATRCKAKISMLIRTNDPAIGVRLELDFIDGLMVHASGRRVELVEVCFR